MQALDRDCASFCVNSAHKQWLESLMDSAIFAVATESGDSAAAVGATKEHVEQIKTFFSATVKEAKRYLTADGPVEENGEEDGGESDESE